MTEYTTDSHLNTICISIAEVKEWAEGYADIDHTMFIF